MSEDKIERDYGGNAFPTEGGVDSGLHPDPGMSLRDWFTGQAAASIIGAISAVRSTDREDAAAIAQASYFLADAMIEARKK